VNPEYENASALGLFANTVNLDRMHVQDYTHTQKRPEKAPKCPPLPNYEALLKQEVKSKESCKFSG
jgi:hypothetical protein